MVKIKDITSLIMLILDQMIKRSDSQCSYSSLSLSESETKYEKPFTSSKYKSKSKS